MAQQEQKKIEKKNIINAYRSLVRAITNRVNAKEKQNIRKAFDLAISAHENARRKSP